MIAGIAMFVACGPSADEKAAMDKARQDSIAAVQKAYDDSLAAANKAAEEKAKQDAEAAANMEKARKDSIEAATKKKTPVKKTNEQKMKEDKKILKKQKG